MANYYASARSNYFKVKDIEAFKAEVNFSNLILDIQNDSICILFEEGIVNDYYNDATDDIIDIDWSDIFKRHLVENSVAIFMESGAEKLCFINGYAIAYSWTGEFVDLSLAEIYNRAKEKFGKTLVFH